MKKLGFLHYFFFKYRRGYYESTFTQIKEISPYLREDHLISCFHGWDHATVIERACVCLFFQKKKRKKKTENKYTRAETELNYLENLQA